MILPRRQSYRVLPADPIISLPADHQQVDFPRNCRIKMLLGPLFGSSGDINEAEGVPHGAQRGLKGAPGTQRDQPKDLKTVPNQRVNALYAHKHAQLHFALNMSSRGGRATLT